MKQPNIASLMDSCRASLISYLTSSLPIGNHASQAQLGRRFYDLWRSEIFKGPFVEALPAYKTGPSLEQLLNTSGDQANLTFLSRLNPSFSWTQFRSSLSFGNFRRASDLLFDSDQAATDGPTPLQELSERNLYDHQIQAFQKVAKERRSVIIATGTGSGKTECFLIPLLYLLLSEDDTVRRRHGVRALLLYPMNALVEDQMSRLRRIMFWANLNSSMGLNPNRRPITFGRYTGQTPVDAKDSNHDRSISEESVPEIGEIQYRQEMQQQPPDILVTNLTMLEYMLLRNDDRALFQSPELLRLLVLDEVHTYDGTRGMEVSTLLRRLNDYLRPLSSQPHYTYIGTSATLGSTPDARQRMKEFATSLFGAELSESDVITGSFESRTLVANAEASSSSSTIVTKINSLEEVCPKFCAAFALALGNQPPEDYEIPAAEWEALAQVFGSSNEQDDATLERVERLGNLLSTSPLFHCFQKCITASDGIIELADLATRIFGISAEAAPATYALGRLFQIATAARVGGQPLISVRAHLFAREHTRGYLCLNPTHSAPLLTDIWWRNLSFVHRQRCTCDSQMYSIVLCRKCGFVLMEGWFRNSKSMILPEPDELLGRKEFRRVLFRPVNSLAPQHLAILEEDGLPRVAMCTKCGLRFPNPSSGHYLQAVAAHGCEPQSIIQVLEWAEECKDYILTECPHCEQTWLKGQEVATYPHLSLYGASSVLVEELKRGVDKQFSGTGLVSKLLVFSDSRQQAAGLAARLQRINEDFTFRQLLFESLSPNEPHTTRSIIDILTSRVYSDVPLQHLFCESEELFDESAIKKRMATHLFRETSSEYRTLESLGICRVQPPRQLLDSLVEAISRDGLGSKLSRDEREDFAELILAWSFRWRRWAVLPHFVLDYGDLGRSDFQDRDIMKLGVAGTNHSGFSLRKADPRNRIFNFYRRLCTKFQSRIFIGDLTTLRPLLERIWDDVMCQSPNLWKRRIGQFPPDDKAFVAVDGNTTDSYRLKLNWLAVRWNLLRDDEHIFICDSCGAPSLYSVVGVCPVRGCSGTLEPTTLEQIRQKDFLPSRHYLLLLREKPPKPLHIEEHTAQISAKARREIERSFKGDELGDVDVISGSTTFEMGIDLGGVNAVLMANVPPEISNYRQRAGRAGRRPGMIPIVFTYVRERPHDAYFWTRLSQFIAGPVRVPRSSRPSHEVLLRHANAAFFAFLMMQYSGRCSLEGPETSAFISFALASQRVRDMEQEVADSSSGLFKTVSHIISANPKLGLTPTFCFAKFRERIEHFRTTYLYLHEQDGAISVLSDYGILPSYNYPIYVDELRLVDQPLSAWPRSSLRLQRDRAIALNEYFPGRVILAGKAPIRSIGLWQGFQKQSFQFCTTCSFINTRGHLAVCPNGCGELSQREGVKPLGGFIGKYEPALRRMDPELFGIQRSQVLFDPANVPPPPLEQFGLALKATRQSSFHIDKTGARMRVFAPRPDSSSSLDLVKSTRRDLGVVGMQQYSCLVLQTEAPGPAEKLFLMHEFTTDILRLQFQNSQVGASLLSSPEYRSAMEHADAPERQKYQTILTYTLGQALCTGAARYLQIGPNDVAFTLRYTPDNALMNKEFIFYDTAPGGAGFCDQLLDDVSSWFSCAVEVLDCSAGCGDSCYSCLRAYENQQIHTYLNRHFVLEGFKVFNLRNWAAHRAFAD